jgi:hypothetical protein
MKDRNALIARRSSRDRGGLHVDVTLRDREMFLSRSVIVAVPRPGAAEPIDGSGPAPHSCGRVTRACSR